MKIAYEGETRQDRRAPINHIVSTTSIFFRVLLLARRTGRESFIILHLTKTENLTGTGFETPLKFSEPIGAIHVETENDAVERKPRRIDEN